MENRRKGRGVLSFLGRSCCWFLAIVTSILGWLPDFLDMPYAIFALAVGLVSAVLAGRFPDAVRR